jgi:hypothetical protein
MFAQVANQVGTWMLPTAAWQVEQMRKLVWLMCAAIIGIPNFVSAQSTAELLGAPKINRTMKISRGRDPNVPDNTEPVLLFRRDDKPRRKLADGMIFSVPPDDAIELYYQGFNPLRIQVAVKFEDVEDPASTQVAKLLEAITSIVGIIKPEALEKLDAAGMRGANREFAEDMSVTCGPELDQVSETINRLSLALFAPGTTAADLSKSLGQWRDEMDRGLDGVKKAMGSIDTAAGDIDKSLVDGMNAIQFLETQLKRDPSQDSACQRIGRRGYQLIQLTQPRKRHEEIKKLVGTLRQLAAAVKPYAEGEWDATDFVVAAPVVPPGMIRKVTLTISNVDITATDAGLVTQVKPVGTGKFDLRRYDRFLPELGVGLVSSNVTRVKFGTGTNAAKETIVTQTDEGSRDFDAALVLNYLVRVKESRSLVPMLQIGASADKDAPTVLVGGGVRLFGQKSQGFAIGAGFALTWLRTLDTAALPLNSPVTGTTQIEESMKYEFQGLGKWYFTLQFNFGAQALNK